MKKIIASLIAIIVICIVILFIREKNSDTGIGLQVNNQPIIQTAVAVTENISDINLNTSQDYLPIIVTEYYHFDGGENSEEILWNFLNKYAPNSYSAAGALGMIYRETKYKSNAFCGWARYRFEEAGCCENFVNLIDNGLIDGSSYEDFIYYVQEKYGGFGLYSLCGYRSLERFYSFAQQWGTSIADAEMQCAFLFWDIENYYPLLWEKLLIETSAYNAGENFGIFYDGTADYEAIAYFSEELYQKYAIYNEE